MNLGTFDRSEHVDNKGGDIIFQCLSWEACDEEGDDGDENDKSYKIFIFGVSEDGKSVCLKINSFTPFYYIKIPVDLQERWTSMHTGIIKSTLKQKYGDGFMGITMCEKIDIKGFTNNKKMKYLRLDFKSHEIYNKSKYYFSPTVWNSTPKKKKGDIDEDRYPRITQISKERLKFDIYEHNIDPYIRFSHIQNIEMAGWVKIKSNHVEYPEYNFSRCQINAESRWDRVCNANIDKICNFTCASFDIECTSFTGKGFPDYKKEKDEITQIGTTLIRFSTGEKLKHITTRKSPVNGGCDELDGIIIETCENEYEIIKKWVSFLEKVDPEFIVGYNTYEFDWKYIYQRCKKINREEVLYNLSRLYNKHAYYRKERLSTSAYGSNYFEFIHPYGICNLDLRVLVKRDHKLDSYKLNNVAQHFTGDVKDDITPQELFEKVKGTNKDMSVVCKYCVQDTNLVADLFIKLCTFSNLIGMSNICRVPISFVELKGQQIKVFSQLLYEARCMGYIVPTIPYNTVSEDTFTGATVLDARAGAYYRPIAGLDFASLYPSIMISNNYCYSTIVDDPEYDDIEGIEYKNIQWVDQDEREYNVKFVQNVKGLLPNMLEKLWKERKRIKKLMKTAETDEMYKIYDGQQLAIKVSMNSIYGFTGATFGRLPDKRIASAVTAEGRKSIEKSKKYAEENYNCEVIYGDTDSIYVQFNTDYDGKKHFNECFKIADKCARDITEKLFKYPMELEFEKIMYPFFLFTKKRYATVTWTSPEKYDYIDYKGIQIKRRDSCTYVKDECSKIFETLMLNNIYDFKFDLDNQNIEIAKNMAITCIEKLLNGEVPINKLIVSKSFRDNYSYENKGICPECKKTWYVKDSNGKKNMIVTKQLLTTITTCPSCKKDVTIEMMPPNLPHVALVEKMKIRDAFNCPVIGDRVPYVFVSGADNLKQYEKVEDPSFAVNNLLDIDYMYYFEHQLKTVLETIFEIISDDSVMQIFKYANDLKPKKIRKVRSKKIKTENVKLEK